MLFVALSQNWTCSQQKGYGHDPRSDLHAVRAGPPLRPHTRGPHHVQSGTGGPPHCSVTGLSPKPALQKPSLPAGPASPGFLDHTTGRVPLSPAQTLPSLKGLVHPAPEPLCSFRALCLQWPARMWPARMWALPRTARLEAALSQTGHFPSKIPVRADRLNEAPCTHHLAFHGRAHHIFLIEQEASLSHVLHVSPPHPTQTMADKPWLKTPDSPPEQSATRKACWHKGCFPNLGPDNQRSAWKRLCPWGCAGRWVPRIPTKCCAQGQGVPAGNACGFCCASRV